MPTPEPPKLNYYHPFFALDEKWCPCDIHFLSWLTKMELKRASIFHFGTGGHHIVGIENSKADKQNSVFGITASPREYNSYIDLIISNPLVGKYYKAYFGDIYQLDAKLLPFFDVVSLFHLCEFRNNKNDLYGALTDIEVAELLVDHLVSGGHILFYRGSDHFEQAVSVIEALAVSKPLQRIDDHESLQVYRKH